MAGGGWGSLPEIYAAARAEAEQDAQAPPVACPNDGELLRTNPDGNLQCQFDGWVWDGQPIRYD